VLVTQEREAPKTTKVAVQKLPIKADLRQGELEMKWPIPETPVDGYVLRYGFSADNLEFQVKLKTEELEKFEDPVHGFAYHYLLREVANDKPLFITIAAYRGAEESAQSRVYTVPAADEKDGVKKP
jgi:hypothetical protein